MVYDIAVVGGGIVGLATSRELLLRHPRLKLANVEKEPGYHRHQTGRNSGVIHSGIYYKPGSLKAKLCVEGRKLAWTYLADKGIPYKPVGKLIVATDPSELGRLDDLWARGHQNGIEDLELLDERQIREREPACRGIKAIFSPVTGIVDWSLVARSYADDAQTGGADMYLGHKVVGIERRAGMTTIQTDKGEIAAKAVVTCAGLYSRRVAQMTGGARSQDRSLPRRLPVLRPKVAVARQHLPVPDPEFLSWAHPPADGSICLTQRCSRLRAKVTTSFSTSTA